MPNFTDELEENERCRLLPALPLTSIEKAAGTSAGAKMKVIEYAPRSWCLLTDGKQYYLDINCILSSTQFSLLLKLVEIEVYRYQTDGTRFLHMIAETIQHSPTLYYNRNQPIPRQRDVRVAIDKWYSRFSISD